MNAILELRRITKVYGRALALENIDFTLLRGEIHALLGENGAGKSTLTKIIAGVVPASSGMVLLEGREVQLKTPSEALNLGIAMVFQETSLVQSMTVAQNLFLGHEKFFNRVRGINIAAQQFMQSLSFAVAPTAMVASLGAAQKQMVEIARAVLLRARIIVFDEPTATLTPEEKRHFFHLVHTLKERGVSVIFISHALEEALAISDRITVLRNGRLVGEHLVADLPRDVLVTKMIGRELDDLEALARSAHRVIDRSGEPVLRAEGIGRRGVLEPADLEVYPGEVVGLAGLLGSGRTELVRLLYGADRADSGHITVQGEPARLTSPRHAIDRRISFSSEDRRGEGVVADLTVAENIVLGIQARRGWARRLRRSERDALVAEYIEALGVRPADPDALVAHLSGGNQQKVLLARWLATAPELLVLDEPTRGIDVGAKADIQRKISELSAQGLAVIFISSELEEVLRLAQRIAVLRDRKKIGELDSGQVDLDGLIDYLANAGKGSAA